MKNYSLAVNFFLHTFYEFFYIFVYSRKNRFTTNAPDSEICIVIKDWFRFDGDRGDERKRGRKEKD